MILVVGGDGTVGAAIKRLCREDGQPFVATSRRPGTGAFLDLADEPENWTIPSGVDSAILCASVTGTKYCEVHPQESRLLNVSRIKSLASRLMERGTFVVFLSSSLVFSPGSEGAREHDATSPSTEYGRQKAEVEAFLLACPSKTAIVRLAKVVFPGLPLFQQWKGDLRMGRAIHAFSNLTFCPVSLEFAARNILTIATNRDFGIHHVTGNGEITYLEAARVICESLGADMDLCVPKEAAADIPMSRTLIVDSKSRLLSPPAIETVSRIALDIA